MNESLSVHRPTLCKLNERNGSTGCPLFAESVILKGSEMSSLREVNLSGEGV